MFPNLILGPNASAVKAIGLPWVSQMIDGRWPMILTTSVKPAVLFLESIWTRLINRGYGNAALFGEDLQQEAYNPFLFASADDKGWKYNLLGSKVAEVESKNQVIPWQPIQVSKEALALIYHIAKEQVLDVSKENETNQAKISEAFEELKEKRIVGQDIKDPNLLTLLTEKCSVVVFPNQRAFVAENNTGQLDRWFQNELNKEKN